MAMFLVNDAKYDIMAEAFVSKYGNPNAKFTFQGHGGKGSIVLRPELLEWLLPQLRPTSAMAKAADGVLRIGRETGIFPVTVPETEEPARRIKSAPATKQGNTGPRKVETATLAEKPKRTRKKKTEKVEPSLADMMAVLQNMNSTVQSLSGRVDAMEEAATEPASSDAPFA